MRYIVAISGASGTIYGVRTVEHLSRYGEVDVIISKEALKVSEYECLDRNQLLNILGKFSKNIYHADELDAPPSSSSYLALVEGIIVSPCSLKTLASIAHGLADNLISRTAINALRIRKKLILVVRETPLGIVEIRNMLHAAEYGAIILPASPGFYNNPQSLRDIVDFIAGKTLDLLGIKHDIYKRWSRNIIRDPTRNLCRQIYGL